MDKREKENGILERGLNGLTNEYLMNMNDFTYYIKIIMNALI